VAAERPPRIGTSAAQPCYNVLVGKWSGRDWIIAGVLVLAGFVLRSCLPSWAWLLLTATAVAFLIREGIKRNAEGSS
jgi:hypothetical protein